LNTKKTRSFVDVDKIFTGHVCVKIVLFIVVW